MSLEYLSPLSESLLQELNLLREDQLGLNLRLHSADSGLPDLQGCDIAILSVGEGRGSESNSETGSGFDLIRKSFYTLFKGNWKSNLADIGHLKAGENLTDSYFALKEICSELLRSNIIPIVLGGGHDLTYPCYRAFDSLEQTVNLTCIDSRFDLGVIGNPLKADSYLSHVIMEEPNNLFNYSNIGYQSFYTSQEEVDLLNGLSFDAFRLGQAKDLKIVEPICRDADIVSVDLSSVRRGESPGCRNSGPNGFYGDEICAIARYAGISDKVNLFGIFEYNPIVDREGLTAELVAQMLWYFIEGYNFRAKDFPFGTKQNYFKYIVPHQDEDITFYKSDKSGRWWMEIQSNLHNKFTRHSLVPCTYEDYLEACDQNIPERWFKAQRKFV
ncbi:MAG: formimidoylglutamase [Flavobacteriaceae bacterium]